MSRRTAALAAGAALVATASVGTLAACGSTHHHVVVSQPAPIAPVGLSMTAYGVPGQCYYIDDQQEALNLIAAGLCQPGWKPYPMPLAWHEEYLDYYNSPTYLTYVPVRYQSNWSNQWGPNSNWYRQNKTTIIVVQKNAVYKDSTGKTVAATAIPSSKFSFGGGVKPSLSLGSVAPPKSVSAPASLGGGVSAKPSLGGGVTQKPPAAPAPKPAPVVPR